MKGSSIHLILMPTGIAFRFRDLQFPECLAEQVGATHTVRLGGGHFR